jgi:DNA-binding SARP family transcriptional activator/tetratricopeptide (TPR) repeat protein
VFWVGVLGPLLVRADGADVVVPAPKQRVILAALALRAGQVASYDELAEVIWDGTPPSGARVAIRNYVKRLRQVLGPVAGRRIVTRDPGYALEAEPDEVDALWFTTLCARGGEAVGRGAAAAGAEAAWDVLSEALALWRGSPLVDVPSNVLITAEVPRLDALRMQGQEWRMDAGLAQGRHSELVGELTQLALDHPWRERFHAQLMLALYRCGRQAEALDAYQRTRRMLVDELGVEPGRELRDLQAGILAGDPGLAAPGPSLASFRVAGGPAQPSASRSTGDKAAGDKAASDKTIGAKVAGAKPGGGARSGRPQPRAAGPAQPKSAGSAQTPDAPGEPVTGTRGSDRGPLRDTTGPADPAADRAGSPAAAPVVPRQLPAGVAHFAGRTAQLAELRAWLQAAGSSDEAVRVLVIGGTAGAGKTALAVHWAHQSAAEFPDGQLYVNLRGFDPSGTPVAAADALRWFLGAFGVPEEQIPDSVDAQAALYRSVLAGKRVLVILDNARDAAQVRPLLPGSPSCLVLVTSRARLPGLAATEGARLLPLDVLTGTEARELLAGRLGERASAEADAARQLTESCSRLPLALSIVAARAAARPLMPLTELSRELADAQGRLDALDAGDPVASIRAVFSWSCQQLSEPAARLFRLLGLHAGPDVTIPAAASLAAVPPAEAAAAVAELADAHLIAEHAPGRYAFHDLLRAYAADLARTNDPAERQHEAVHRVLDHYLHTAFAGARLVNPARPLLPVEQPRPGVTPEVLTCAADAQSWFAAERQVLLAAISQAEEAGLDTYAWQLPWAVWLFFDREGYWHDQVAIQHTAIAAARRLGDRAAQAHVYRDLSATYSRLGLLAEARDYGTKALDLHHEVGDRIGEARAHNDIMILAERQGRLAEALNHAQLALALYRVEGNKPGEAKMLNGVGYIHAQLGEYQQALESCEQALSMTRGRGDPLNEGATWDSVGYVLFHLGRYDEAITHIRTALRTIEGTAVGYYQTTMLVHLGDVYHAVGDQEQARQAWEQALAILEHLHHSDADQVRARLRGQLPTMPGSVPGAAVGGLTRGHAVGA